MIKLKIIAYKFKILLKIDKIIIFKKNYDNIRYI